MPFSRPSLSTLIERTESDVESRLTGAPLLRKALARIVARALAGVAHGLYGFIDYLAGNILPTTATGAFLRAWASMYRINQREASYASGTATVSVPAPSTIPAGTVLVRGDGVEYLVDQEAVSVDGSIQVEITAADPGAGGNAEAGTLLSLQSPVPGVNDSLAIDADIGNGAEAETEEQLRERILLRTRNQPQGGAETDYQQWALSVPGVTRAWVFPLWMGAGTVGVAVVNDNANPITPSEDLLDEVRDYIETVRPVTAEVYVFAPELLPINHELELSPVSARPAVIQSLAEFYTRVGEPGATIYLSQLSEAISVADGEEWHRIIEPSQAIEPEIYQIPVLGAVTWA